MKTIRDFFDVIKWQIRYYSLYYEHIKLKSAFEDLLEQVDDDFVGVIS